MRSTASSSKYKNRKVFTEDGEFDSKKEYGRWIVLKARQNDGLIQHLQRQVEYELIPKFKAQGESFRACCYKADFVYTENGEIVVEDVKSEYTRKLPEYRIKKKLLAWKYGIVIKEV